jgi:hypothetical protein
MNYCGSYRKLLGNAKSAMMAAIEIYNKPMFGYRDECVVILLLNAWELLLKAILSKNKKSVYYPKKRNRPYRTLSWQDAFTKAQCYFPTELSPLPIRKNLDLLSTYRDNTVHFYNTKEFGVVLYALSQTCIKNFRDLMSAVFNINLEDEINWQLLPLGVRPPIDLATYLSKPSKADEKSMAVKQFLAALAEATIELQNSNEDTSRLLTVFNVKLESVKKIGDSDIVIGVGKADANEGPLAIVRTQDPNVTHPLRQKEIIESIDQLQGIPFNSYVFQAILWRYDIKKNPQYCWIASEGVLTRYSRDIIPFLKRLSKEEIYSAIDDYKEYMKRKRRKKN